jgi:asparagine synthase (glutamine-hydrolysing)
MCGICGIFRPDGAPVDADRVLRMRDAMTPRGPDGCGLISGPGYALGHRRLSIIDLSADGQQPMANEDGSIWVVFNGEIYNFADLRGELLAEGHHFRSRSDTEVLIHGYENWGIEELLRRIRGMFAFALLDTRRNQIHLARDPLGKKPLYFRWSDHELAFASSARALNLGLRSTPALNLASIDDLLWNNHIPLRKTIFQGVEKVLAGHAWSLDGEERISELTHWRPSCYRPEYGVTESEWLERIEDALLTAVKRRFVSDVPVGTMLSGGVDSSLVTALAAKAMGQVKTFTVANEDPREDESPYAAAVAERYHTEQHVLRTHSRVREELPRLIAAMGEPFADSSAINVFTISALARQWVTVVLTGDGGDEAFGGYRSHFAVHCAGLLAPMASRLRWPLSYCIPALYRGGLVLHKTGTLLDMASGSLEWYMGNLHGGDAKLRNDLYTPAFHSALAGHNPRGYVLDIVAQSRAESWGNRIMECDLRCSLVDDMLTKVDVASMAVSMETRCPFLDIDVIDLASRIPTRIRFSGLRRKGLLRALARRHLPRETVDRKKLGFGVPVGLWFRRDWTDIVQEFILGPHVEQRGWFRRQTLERIVAEHRQGAAHQDLLWALLVLELWLRLVVDCTLSPTDTL